MRIARTGFLIVAMAAGSLMAEVGPKAVNDGSTAPANPPAVSGGSSVTSAATGTTRATGTVQSVDPQTNQITIQDSTGHNTTYNVSKDTTFVSENAQRKFTDVKAGDGVNLDCNPDLGVINVEIVPRKR